MRGALLAVAIATLAQQGGPPGVFIKEVPDHKLSVIQGAPTANSTRLSLMAPADLKVTLSLTKGRAPQTEFDLKANMPQTVTVTGLPSGQATAYTLRYEAGEMNGVLRTPKPAGTDFSFAIQADSHLDENSSGAVYERTLRAIAADKPEFAIDLGDTFMTGKHLEFKEAVSQYRVQRYYFGVVGVNAPVFLALGNHDGETGWVERGQTGMTEWSKSQRESHFPSAATEAKGLYYSVVWGDVLAIVLDPFSFTPSKPGRTGDNWAWTLGKTQYDWLKKTLEQSKAKYRLVFIHHLVGGSGKDARGGAEASVGFEWGGVDDFGAKRSGWEAPIHELLKKHGVQAVFRGHDHLYAMQRRDGIVYQCVPQPSHARGDSTRSAAEYSYKSGTILGSSGYLRCSVAKDGLKVEYVKLGTTPSVAHQYVLTPVNP